MYVYACENEEKISVLKETIHVHDVVFFSFFFFVPKNGYLGRRHFYLISLMGDIIV